jgi:hypothetical protein
VPESGPERRRFRRPRELDAEAETGPEVGDFAAGSGESGWGPAGGAGIRGGGVAEIAESGRSEN